MRHITLSSAARLGWLALVCGTVAAANWSDPFIGMRYGTDYAEPGNTKDISKRIVQLQYVGGFAYGDNFVNLDLLFSDADDPARNGGGAREAYLVYRNTLSFSAIRGKPVKFGPVRDVGWMTGIDLNTKDTRFAPRKKLFVTGPKLRFDVPGFWDVSLLFMKERNNNGIVGRKVNFDATWGVSTAWSFPISTSVPLKFKGFANYIDEKGKDGFGVQTEPETLLESALLADVSKFYDKKNQLWAGVGYQYWRNKFGNRPGNGTEAKVPQLLLEFHL
ncbi:hypothetical protein [Chitinimonas sp. JJ19]|uniref:hypothetical protein n=1 Tax=Chitinimonas sp. JJ19 TaxID=3109352 RepID=UPI003000AE0A